MSMVDISNNVTPSADPEAIQIDEPPMASASEPAPRVVDEMDVDTTAPEKPDASLAPPQSQPMTASTSSASQNLELDDGDSSAANTYGTRSRNRNGASRPNYADDKELDMEIEASGRIPKQAKKVATQSNTDAGSAVQEEIKNTTVQNGFAAVNVHANIADGASSATKDTIPGTSSFSTQPAAPVPSKKRKQPGSNTVVSAIAPTQSSRQRASGPSSSSRLHIETNMMTFIRHKARLNAKKELVADDGTALSVNNHAYFVCEPPGEPYYLARIMEFLPATSEPDSHIDAVRVNWYYRPKDIQRRVQDTRVVFCTMHSDTCPLTSLRGKCNIQHLSEIVDLDKYRKEKDHFWFDKLYDRYMHRYYEVIPTGKIINVPQHVKKVLDERWKFVLVEIGRGKELTSQVKTCKKCSLYSASQDSVDCAVCKNTYHMACIRPPLLRKPARGFAWACAACSRAQELRLEARHTPSLAEGAQAGDEDMPDEEEEDSGARNGATRENSAAPDAHPPPTEQQLAQANLWPYRYLGVHARVEDALDYDDRIYPRASSRLGPRHQANVNVWHGRPFELVKPAEIKRKYFKSAGNKKDGKLAKEHLAQVEADKESKLKRPKWVIDEPIGYIARGEDTPVDVKGKKEFTGQLTFKMPDPSLLPSRGEDENAIPDDGEKLVDEYIERVKSLAPQYHLKSFSVDLLTKAVEKLQENNYDVERAFEAMRHLNLRSDLKQPELNREEVKRFEEGVTKYGSELHNVARHVGPNFKESRIVRFYYLWKKTDRGRQVWGNYEGRKSKKESKRLEKDGTTTKLLDDVADDADDSAFDNEKAIEKKRGFECKFCQTRSSRQWRRAPGTAPGTLIPREAASKNSKDKSNWLTLALCGKCAYLWRRYAIQYESIEEVSKKIAAAGGRASKRRIDEELMRTIVEAQQESGDTISATTFAVVASNGVQLPDTIVQAPEPKKTGKGVKLPSESTPEVMPKKPKEPVPEPPLVFEPPKIMVHPCATCGGEGVPNEDLLVCRDCRLHVHAYCYGERVGPDFNSKKWTCDMCKNDHNPQVSTTYECVLCPVRFTQQELFEPYKASHKRKTDREREKERVEKEMIATASHKWRQEQEATGRPVTPREPLKPTAANNWMHIICALWTKEIKYGNAVRLDGAEGMGFVLPEKFMAECKICKASGKHPTIKCHAQGCNADFHVGCARQAGYRFGFDISVVKGTRRDALNAIKLDKETGVPTAAVWCPNHAITSYVHSMVEATEEGITAMQLFAKTYKQADESITGTVRRAAQFAQQPVMSSATAQTAPRRTSTMNGVQAMFNGRIERSPSVASASRSADDANENDAAVSATARDGSGESSKKPKKCCNCSVNSSPWWWPISKPKQTPTPSGTTINGIPASSIIAPLNLAEGHHRTSSSGAPINGNLTNIATPQKEFTQMNGVIKAEMSPQLTQNDLQREESEKVYQCQKCHARKLTPPLDSLQVKARKPPEPTYSAYVDTEPLFYQAPHGPQPSYQRHWDQPRSQLNGPAHSHPSVPPQPQHLGHVPWPPTAPPTHHSPVTQNSSWLPPNARNGAPPLPNGMSTGQQYGHTSVPPPPASRYDPYGARSSYLSFSGPPPRPQSTSVPLPHPSPQVGYGPPQSQANYPASPRGYGPPPSVDHPMTGTSPLPPRQYGAPPREPDHSRPGLDGPGPGPMPSPRLDPPRHTASPQVNVHNSGPPRHYSDGSHYGHARHPSGGMDAGRPSTPKVAADKERERDGGQRERPGPGPGPGAGGASASPNLRNLLS